MAAARNSVIMKRKKEAFFDEKDGSSEELKKTKKDELLHLVKWLSDEEWREALKSEFAAAYMQNLALFAASERKRACVYPPEELVFAALNACPLSRVKVVIVGQDPYHGPGQATGLAFSLQPGARCKFPPSLRNILKEVSRENFRVSEGQSDLIKWAKQGVLLLNTCLTVQGGKANSHQKKGWEQFTDAVISAVDARPTGVVFLLWGKPALAKCKNINTNTHRIIVTSHPSPLSNTKTDTPFTNSSCFSRCNTALKDLGHRTTIDWALQDDEQ